MEGKEGQEEQVQNRSDVKPGEHGDGKGASRLLCLTWPGGSCSGCKLCLNGFAVEKNQPPDYDNQWQAIEEQENPTNCLHTVRGQVRDTLRWNKGNEEDYGNPDRAEKDAKSAPNQRRDPCPISQKDKPDPRRDAEDCQAHHEPQRGQHGASHKRLGFHGISG